MAPSLLVETMSRDEHVISSMVGADTVSESLNESCSSIDLLFFSSG